MGRPRNQSHNPAINIPTIIWANIIKWQMIKGISDSELAFLLNVKTLADRKRTHYITGDDIERICGLMQIEPEKLFER